MLQIANHPMLRFGGFFTFRMLWGPTQKNTLLSRVVINHASTLPRIFLGPFLASLWGPYPVLAGSGIDSFFKTAKMNLDLLFNPNIMVHYMATYKVKEDKLDDIEKAIAEFVGAVRDNEPNTLIYASFHRKDDPLSFVHFMCFENEEAKDFHESADYTKKFVEMLSVCCAVKNVFTELNLVRSNKV